MSPGPYSYPHDLDWRAMLARFRCESVAGSGRCQLYVNHDGACAHATLHDDAARRTRRGRPLHTAAVLVRWDVTGEWVQDLDEWRGAADDPLPWCCMFSP